MNTNRQRKINIATILVLALIAVSTSPMAVRQMIAFVTLLAVVFGRDLVLGRLSQKNCDKVVA